MDTNLWRKGPPPRYVAAWYKRRPDMVPDGPTDPWPVEGRPTHRERRAAMRHVKASAIYDHSAASRQKMGHWVWVRVRRMVPTALQKATGDLYRWLRKGNCNEFAPGFGEALMELGAPRNCMRLVICKVKGETFLHMALMVYINAMIRRGWEWHDNRFASPLDVDSGGPQGYEIVAMEGPDAETWYYRKPPRRTLADLLK